jgi:hypothetical protein
VTGGFTEAYAEDEALGGPRVEAGEVGRVEGDQAAHGGEARRRRARVGRLRPRHGAAEAAHQQQEQRSVTAAGGGARPRRLHFQPLLCFPSLCAVAAPAGEFLPDERELDEQLAVRRGSTYVVDGQNVLGEDAGGLIGRRCRWLVIETPSALA